MHTGGGGGGEIVGIYGLMGAGRTELFECLLGKVGYSGRFSLNGKVVNAKIHTPDRIKMGLGLVPEDRKQAGIFPVSSVASNLTISSLWKRLKGMVISESEENRTISNGMKKV